jgi:hypothetical protein
MQKQIGYAKKCDEGRERWAFDRHTSAHTSPKGGGPGTLAKHWANRPEGSLPSSFSQGTSIIKQHKERDKKPPREAHGPLQASLLILIRDLGAGTSAALPLN